MKHIPDILDCIANLSNDEVFTPPSVVNKMVDLLPQELWSNPNAKFLDPFTKSGIFLREIAKRLLEGLKDQIPDLQERINHIFGKQLYGIAITELTALTSRRTLYCTKTANHQKYAQATIFNDANGNIFFEELSHTFEKGKCIYCGINDKELNEENREGRNKFAYPFIHNCNPYENMKFDVIIGNPPYQISDNQEGGGISATTIYHLFIQQAIKLDPHYLVMITPSRWFAGGKGLDDFREEMLNDNRLKEIHDYPNASDVFPGVTIGGGVNYFLWQNDYKGDCLIKTYEGGELISEMKRPLKEKGADIFIRYNDAIPILKKVQSFDEKSFSEVVSSRKPFGFPTNFKAYKKEQDAQNRVKIFGNKIVGYINEEQIEKNKEWLSLHKVLVSRLYGAPKSFPELIINKPFISEPNSCCTETYLVIGPFRDKQRCENVMSYIRTRFFRFMVMLKKQTQDATKKSYQFVPMQDFSKPWTDEELYKKYNLSQEEITYIESMVREMP